MNYSLGRRVDPNLRSHMASCARCQNRMQELEAGLVDDAEQEALPNAPLAPAIQLLDQKSVLEANPKDSPNHPVSGTKTPTCTQRNKPSSHASEGPTKGNADRKKSIEERKRKRRKRAI